MIRLYAFHGGEEDWDKSIFTSQRGIGTTITIPVQFFLVEHPKGRVMFDTGLHPDHVVNVQRVRSVRPWVTRASESDLVPARLDSIGLKPEDVAYVANSHLHYDHAGGNRYFPHATFLVQFDELRGAMWPEPWLRRNYDRVDFDLPVKFEELDGDYDVFGDGKVMLVKLPGHTAGCQGMLVELDKSGPILLAQDAFYLRENLDDLVLSTNVWNPLAMITSYRRLREFRRLRNALLVPGHDIEAWRALKHAPAFYD